MVKVEIFIKQQQIDLYDGINYSMTKQVNEFTELRSRQWNYTDKYKVPKTARNKKVFSFLSYPGNTSNIAYERIEGAQMYMNGIPIIMSGYALVDETDTDYNIVMYEGSVTFFESIKELTLQNLDWNGIDHSYGKDTMEASWPNTEGYIYPVARTTTLQPLGRSWFDLPSPSVYVKDIVQKIADISGIAIEGTLLADPNYNKTVITTEKPIRLSQSNTTLIDTDTLNRTVGVDTSFTEPTPPEVTGALDYYKIDLDYSVYGDTDPSIDFKVNGVSTDGIILTDELGTRTWYAYGSSFSATMSATNPNGIQTTVILTLKANRINFGTVAVKFSELMPDMSLTVFMKQIMTLFGVNIYPNIKETKVRLDFINDFDTAEVVDISKYLQGGDKESYQFGGYTSKNEFNYTIDDTLQVQDSNAYLYYSHNKGEKTTHFTSSFKQPEIAYEDIYRNYLFDNELNPLESDLKIFQIEQSTRDIIITTANGINGKTVTGYATYNFENLRFSYLLSRYYSFIQERVFRNPIKIFRTFALPIIRFYNLDMQKLYYLQQEGSFYMINQIKMNSRGLTEAELIKVERKKIIPTDPVAIITGETLYTEPGNVDVQLYGTDSYSIGGYIDSYSWVIKEGLTTLYTSDKNNVLFELEEGSTYEVCLTVTNEQANTNTRCINVESRPPVIDEPDAISDITLIKSDSCYTYMQFKLNGTPSTDFDLTIRSSIINGKSRLVIWDANGSVGSNCQVTGCPFLGEIILPRLGPGVNEVHYNDELDFIVPLDVSGEAYMQLRIEGVKDSMSPIDNGTFVTAKDNDSGFVKTIVQRYWAKTTQCDSF